MKKYIAAFLIIFITSCANVHTVPEIAEPYKPPEFSFLDNVDPNMVDVEYVRRMKKYDRIIGESPIPVFVVSLNEFAAEIFLKIKIESEIKTVKEVNILGMYFYGQSISGWPNEFIFVNKWLTPEQIMATYFHELGHYLHRDSECLGCMLSPIVRESHALLNELEMGWEYDVPYVLESSIRTMAVYAIDADAEPTYKAATFEVMKTTTWRKVMDKLKELEKGESE